MSVIWSGIYKDISEAPSVGEGFAGERWRRSCSERFTSLAEQLEETPGVPCRPAYSESPLPLLVGTICAEQGEARVLDFGGGLGESYLLTKASVPEDTNLVFHIHEVPEVCAAGRELYGENGPSFVDRILEAHTSYDVVHLGSSIHYIEDWAGCIASCAAMAKRYLSFVDLPAGEIPTFATTQTYYESKIPVWFFNLKEFVDQVEAQGFSLVWRSTYAGLIKGRRQPLPLDDFPEDHRLSYCCNLLFQRDAL